MLEVGVKATVEPDRVLRRSIAGVRAVAAVPHLGGADRLDEGGVVEILRLAPSLLPEDQTRVTIPDLNNPLRDAVEGVVPCGLLPLPGDALLVRPEKRRLDPVRVVEGRNLGFALRTKGPQISRVVGMTRELHDPSVDLSGEHSAILLPDPACGGDKRLRERSGQRFLPGHQDGGQMTAEGGELTHDSSPGGGRSAQLQKGPSGVFHPWIPLGESWRGYEKGTPTPINPPPSPWQSSFGAGR